MEDKTAEVLVLDELTGQVSALSDDGDGLQWAIA